jgi:hypothetical protein
LGAINLSLVLDKQVFESDFLSVTESNFELENQSKSFLFFYLNYGILPFITFNDGVENGYHILKLRFSGNKALRVFYECFGELYSQLLNTILAKKVVVLKKVRVLKQINFNCTTSLLNSYSLKYYFKEILNITTAKGPSFFVSFTFKT